MDSVQDTTITRSNGIRSMTPYGLRPPLPSKWGPKCTVHPSWYVEFRITIYPQRVIRSTSHFVLGYGFRGSADPIALSPVRSNRGRQPATILENYSGNCSIARFPRDSTAFLYWAAVRCNVCISSPLAYDAIDNDWLTGSDLRAWATLQAAEVLIGARERRTGASDRPVADSGEDLVPESPLQGQEGR